MSEPAGPQPSVPIAYILKGGEEAARSHIQLIATSEGIPEDWLTISRRADGIVVVRLLASALNDLPNLRKYELPEWMPFGEHGRGDH